MATFQQIARENRQKNSGGRYPDPLANATTLAILLRRLSRIPEKDRPAITIVALHLWLTQRWLDIRSVDDIPDFYRISGSTACRANTFRNYKDGAISWSEYSLAYDDGNEVHYLWQPIPVYLNAYFQPFISSQSYETPFLRTKDKILLLRIMCNKWSTPSPLASFPRVRRDTFHQYFIDCALADNTLTALPRAKLIPRNQQHHKHSESYQNNDSDRIRYKLFDAQNRYLDRLIRAARNADLSHHFELFQANYSINLITVTPHVAEYLTSPGRISQTVLDTSNGTLQSIRSPSIKLGSKRYLEETAVVHFFQKLFTFLQSQKPLQPANKNLWVRYYNTATYRVALLFILLTGTRPTHSISILNPFYGGDDIVFVKDKGRLRQVIVCDYLQGEIKNYRIFQAFILALFEIDAPLDELWFGINDNGQPFRLSNRLLRQFINQHWEGVVPYQLRHFFAQSAVSNMSSIRLLDQDIDRLMGHESQGEHLGSDIVFPQTFLAMKNYLNQYANKLVLKEFSYV